MIQPDAVGVKGGRIRIAGVELGQAFPEFSAVRDGICVQVWLHGSWSLRARGVRDHGFLGGGLAQPQSLVGEEEERLVFEDGTAQHTAKVILPLRRFG